MNEIICGECLRELEKIPSESIGALITDPPYSSGGFTRGDRNQKPDTKYLNVQGNYANFSGDNRDARSWTRWCAWWLMECFRVLKDGAYFACFVDWRMLPNLTDAVQMAGFVWRGLIVWDKVHARPNPGMFSAQCEYAVWGTKGALRPRKIYPKGCFPEPIKTKQKFHLTGKPLGLMEKIVAVIPEGESILDPFAGSGTTLVAAKRLGYDYIGIEMSEHYADIARRRLARVERASDEYIARLRKNKPSGDFEEDLDGIDFGDVPELTDEDADRDNEIG